MLQTGERTLPKQVQIWAPEANNQVVALPHECSIFLYRAPRLWQSEISADAGGLRLATLKNVEERYVTDAYHSLSIEGYRVTPELVEKVRNGQWQPDGEDAKTRDAMATKGYYEAHPRVKDYIAQTLTARPEHWPLHDALTGWYRALFSPSVVAGILKASDLAGWRNDQVFIRGALHVPLSKEKGPLRNRKRPL